ncbi:hypothetical protein [Mycobacterium tuberculosis]|uniref:hypothetical protein n=1 Tax=Mycobacterium tuberculosis TaxID=1773 RepID=UPI00272A7F05|nr:hypothetical protein [Mycobacterium tuberculosis]
MVDGCFGNGGAGGVGGPAGAGTTFGVAAVTVAPASCRRSAVGAGRAGPFVVVLAAGRRRAHDWVSPPRCRVGDPRWAPAGRGRSWWF